MNIVLAIASVILGTAFLLVGGHFSWTFGHDYFGQDAGSTERILYGVAGLGCSAGGALWLSLAKASDGIKAKAIICLVGFGCISYNAVALGSILLVTDSRQAAGEKGYQDKGKTDSTERKRLLSELDRLPVATRPQSAVEADMKRYESLSGPAAEKRRADLKTELHSITRPAEIHAKLAEMDAPAEVKVNVEAKRNEAIRRFTGASEDAAFKGLVLLLFILTDIAPGVLFSAAIDIGRRRSPKAEPQGEPSTSEGFRRFGGVITPDNSQTAGDGVLRDWLRECVDVRKGGWERSSSLKADLATYCRARNADPVSDSRLWAALKMVGATDRRYRGANGWDGVKLRADMRLAA